MKKMFQVSTLIFKQRTKINAFYLCREILMRIQKNCFYSFVFQNIQLFLEIFIEIQKLYKLFFKHSKLKSNILLSNQQLLIMTRLQTALDITTL